MVCEFAKEAACPPPPPPPPPPPSQPLSQVLDLSARPAVTAVPPSRRSAATGAPSSTAAHDAPRPQSAEPSEDADNRGATRRRRHAPTRGRRREGERRVGGEGAVGDTAATDAPAPTKRRKHSLSSSSSGESVRSSGHQGGRTGLRSDSRGNLAGQEPTAAAAVTHGRSDAARGSTHTADWTDRGGQRRRYQPEKRDRRRGATDGRQTAGGKRTATKTSSAKTDAKSSKRTSLRAASGQHKATGSCASARSVLHTRSHAQLQDVLSQKPISV